MRIGINALFLIPGEVGGSEVYLCQTLGAMAKNHPEETFILFTNNENDGFLRTLFSNLSNINFKALKFSAVNRYSRIIREQTQLPFQAQKAKVECLWSPGYTSPILTHCPQIVSILDMQYKRHPADLTPIAGITTDILVKSACTRAKRLLTISEFSKREIVELAKVNSDNIRVTHLAASKDFSDRKPVAEIKAARLKYLPFDLPYILNVSHSYPHKNLPLLIRSMNHLLGKIPHQLIILGKPRLGEPEVQKELKSFDLKNRVTRIDHVSKSDLIALYQGADLFVFPSLYEGFGLPVLEAMMAKAPVIAARMGSIPEIGGDCITYFNGTDAGALGKEILNTVNADKINRNRLTMAAFERAQEFSWESTADKTINCLRSVLAKSSK